MMLQMIMVLGEEGKGQGENPRLTMRAMMLFLTDQLRALSFFFARRVAD